MDAKALVAELAEAHKRHAELEDRIRCIVHLLAGDTTGPLGGEKLAGGLPGGPSAPVLDGLRIWPATLKYLMWAKASDKAVTLRDLHTALTSCRVVNALGKDIRTLQPRKGTTPKIDAAWKALTGVLASPKYTKQLLITAPAGSVPGRTRFQPEFTIALRST